MHPITLEEAEGDLRAAYLDGDPVKIAAAEALVDRLDVHPVLPSLHSSALWYAEQGIHVFPLAPGSKVPLISKEAGGQGCKDGTTDTVQINAWWTTTPEANIGIATGHLIDGVDIDGALGQKSRCDNWGMFEALTIVAKVLTPRAGGVHLYVCASGYGNKAGLLPGIDYRGKNGYIVAPPSRTPDGNYQFLAPLDVAALARAAA